MNWFQFTVDRSSKNYLESFQKHSLNVREVILYNTIIFLFRQIRISLCSKSRIQNSTQPKFLNLVLQVSKRLQIYLIDASWIPKPKGREALSLLFNQTSVLVGYVAMEYIQNTLTQISRWLSPLLTSSLTQLSLNKTTPTTVFKIATHHTNSHISDPFYSALFFFSFSTVPNNL